MEATGLNKFFWWSLFTVGYFNLINHTALPKPYVSYFISLSATSLRWLEAHGHWGGDVCTLKTQKGFCVNLPFPNLLWVSQFLWNFNRKSLLLAIEISYSIEIFPCLGWGSVTLLQLPLEQKIAQPMTTDFSLYETFLEMENEGHLGKFYIIQPWQNWDNWLNKPVSQFHFGADIDRDIFTK